MYSIYQHWDPLKACIVGKSYNPKFYDYITNKKVRQVFYKIAEETEEDYQKLIQLLKSFDIEIFRPEVSDSHKDYLDNGLVLPPPMNPRDNTAMIGNNFYIDTKDVAKDWNNLKGSNWPDCPTSFKDIPDWVLNECKNHNVYWSANDFCYNDILKHVKNHANIVLNKNVNSAMTTRIGKDLYFGTQSAAQDIGPLKYQVQELFPNYRCHIIETEGHADSSFCPVVPGLIVSLLDMPTYKDTFPDWEVVYVEGQSWSKVDSFLKLKQKNAGKWWVPGQELNEDFTTFVETWMNHWVGYVEETVFDVNMLVIDEKNVVCNGYNQIVFDAFSQRGITAHVVNFRHRYFWDGGLHCITSDLHREGTMQDYFPKRL